MAQTRQAAQIITKADADAVAADSCDPIWMTTRREAEQVMEDEPALGGFMFAAVLGHARLEEAISYSLAQRLEHSDMHAAELRRVLSQLLDSDSVNCAAFRADLAAVLHRDPACTRYLEPLLYFQGFQALAAYRFAHALWNAGRKDFALFLQSQSARCFGIDINPAAKIGDGILLDHGSGIVIGETAMVGDNCSILQGVTLGGTGKECGDRHPKIGRNVLIGAGAHVLGNITVGDCSLIAAGSVVLKPVPCQTTVAGVPAKIVGPANCPEPARSMDQRLAPDDCGGAARQDDDV